MDETRGHGVVNMVEFKEVVFKLKAIAEEHKVSEFFSDVIEALANMPKVVTNLEDVIAE